MPKLKTHKGAASRIKVTGSGKLMRMKRHSSHLRRKKPTAVKRLFAAKLPLDATQRRRVQRMLPYAGR